MLKEQPCHSKNSVIIIDDCNFGRLALHQLLGAHCYDVTFIPLPVTDKHNLLPAKVPDAVIVKLQYQIDKQFNVIQSLVLSCIQQKYEGPVVIITDMSLECIRALVYLAGLTDDSVGNVYAIPSRLPPQQMKCALQDIIAGTTALKPVFSRVFHLTPLRQASLMAMIEGVPEKQQARNQNCPIKSVYNHRYTVIQQLAGVSQHAFRCGAFARRLSQLHHGMVVC